MGRCGSSKILFRAREKFNDSRKASIVLVHNIWSVKMQRSNMKSETEEDSDIGGLF